MKPMFVVVMIGWGLWQAPAVAGPPAASAETPATTSSVDPPRDVSATLAPLLERHRIPAMVAAVVHDARIVTVGAAGVRQRGRREPVTIDDRFHLGSQTKSMTATLCAMLVEDGKLRWDSTLAEIFPDLKATMLSDYRSVTLEQLLTQRSGFGEPERICSPDFLQKLVAFKGAPDEARRMGLEYVVTRKPEAPQGSRFIYSNVNYVIAGHMAETEWAGRGKS